MTNDNLKHIKNAEKFRSKMKKAFAAGDQCIKGEISFDQFEVVNLILK